ncbi:MAG: protein kinase [Deltaproteobacteria bacterium]|nr:protein kinase [Deltaproteobacteria bacterium]
MEENSSNIFPKPVPGDLVDRRFRVSRLLENCILGASYGVQEGERPKVLRLFDPVSGLGHPSEQNLPNVVEYWQTHLESALIPFETWGKCEGSSYLVRPWVEGVSLAQILAERVQHGATISEQEQETWILGLLEAMRTLHRYEVFGTLKPSNIFLTKDSKIVLTDFALMSLIPHAELIGCYLTKDSYFYLAPELIGGDLVTPQSDIYSIGVILEEMLTLTLPKGRGLDPVLKGSPWESVLARCLAVEPGERFQSVEALEKAIRPILLREPTLSEHVPAAVGSEEEGPITIPIPLEDSRPSSSHRLGWGAVLFVGVLIGFGYFALQKQEKPAPSLQIEERYDLALETSLLSPPLMGDEIGIDEPVEPEIMIPSPPAPQESVIPPSSKSVLPGPASQQEEGFTSVPVCPKEMILLNRAKKRVCIDPHPFPNVSEGSPVRTQTFDEALERCRSVGKEICAEISWEYACEKGMIHRQTQIPEWVVDAVGQAQLKEGESCSDRGAHSLENSPANAVFHCCASPFLRWVSSRR